MSENIESVASIRARAERQLTRHQRLIELITGALGQPRTVYAVLVLVLGWIAFNVALPLPAGHVRIDPPPFFWLQGCLGLSSLLMTTFVLITENRQTRNAEERSHLDLQVNLLAEHKIAKLIGLLEELRRDLPMVKDRVDQEAAEMQTAVDPEALLAALARDRCSEPEKDEGTAEPTRRDDPV